MFNWLKKKILNASPGSPGKTAEIMVEHYLSISNTGDLDQEDVFTILVGRRVMSWRMGNIMPEYFTSESMSAIVEQSSGDLPTLTFILMFTESPIFRKSVKAHPNTLEATTETIYNKINRKAPDAISKSLSKFQDVAFQFSKNYKNILGSNIAQGSSEENSNVSNSHREGKASLPSEGNYRKDISREEGSYLQPIFEENYSYEEFKNKYKCKKIALAENSETGKIGFITDSGITGFIGDSLPFSAGDDLSKVDVDLLKPNIVHVFTERDDVFFLKSPRSYNSWNKSKIKR